MFAVAGVSGNTGRVVAESLLSKKLPVRVIVRTAEKGAEWRARGAEVAVADLGDAEAMTRALAGTRGAYLLVPPNMGASDFRGYQRATGAALAQALRAAKTPEVVFLSSIGAELPSGTGPIAGLHDVEAQLSGIPGTRVTFLRPAYFMENVASSLGALEHGVFPSFTPKALGFEMIATRDIGAQAASFLAEGAPGGVVNLGAGLVSSDDVARELSRITGKTITVAEAPVSSMATTLAGYGMPPAMAALYQEMTEALIDGRLGFDKTTRRVVTPTKIGTLLESLVAR